MAEPDQYIYNPAFHFKMLFMAVAGFNALVVLSDGGARTMAPGGRRRSAARREDHRRHLDRDVDRVIVCGRMLTFYRPGLCGPEGPGFLAECIPQITRGS